MQAARKVKKVASEDSELKRVIIVENESEQNLPARTQPKPSVPIPLLIAWGGGGGAPEQTIIRIVFFSIKAMLMVKNMCSNGQVWEGEVPEQPMIRTVFFSSAIIMVKNICSNVKYMI